MMRRLKLALFLAVSLVSGYLSTCLATDFGVLFDEIEAEDGILNGVSVSTSKAGYSGTAYVTGFDTEGDELIVNLNIQQTGFYRIVVRYDGSSGNKYQYFTVNNSPLSLLYFPQFLGFTDRDAGNYILSEGTNTISIKKNWGWTDIDKFMIYYSGENIYQPDPAPVNPAADSNAIALYNMLRLQFGYRTISGQTVSSFNEVAQLTGKTPMYRVGDLMNYTEGYPYAWNDGHTFGVVDDGSVEDMVDWYKSTGGKGIVGFQWHWCSPSGGEAGTNTFYTDFTTFDIRQAVLPGTDENTLILRDIDAIAAQLKKFRDAGIPVLWRPLHEAGGGWFWWGAHGAQPCLELYDIIYDRLTNFHQLNNLIWVWSTPEEDWYPGNDKLDIIGYDSYPGAFNYGTQKTIFDDLYRITAGNKMIAMTENGPIPDINECFAGDVPWLLFMSWSDLVFEQNSNEHIIDIYNNEMVLTLESENIRTDSIWRSMLYPENWKPGYKDSRGRYLHDFSYAGYHRGEQEPPVITANILDVTNPPYNADNTGSTDVTAILQQAIDDAGTAGGGVVYLPAGKYRVSPQAENSETLWLNSNNVVIRGAGPDSTFIFNDAENMRYKNIITVRSSWSDWLDETATVAGIRADLTEASRIIPVESVSGFEAGDRIIIRSDASDAFIAEHKMQGIWTSDAIGGVAFYRTIDSVDSERKLIFIDSPTRYFMKTRDNARLYLAGEHIEECGIENLSIGNRENSGSGWDEESYQVEGTGAWEVHFSHAIQFKYATNCWVRNVHTYKPEENSLDVHLLSNCLLLQMSSCITVDSCDFRKPQYEGGGGNGYIYILSSNDCLVKNCLADDGRHNYDFKNTWSNGNVILNCRGENSRYSSDFHMYLSMANLFDGFTVNGDYLESTFRPWGGSAIHGYSSTESVFYNTKGESYHPDKNYVIDSRQYGNGYIIGTSGPADNVLRYPVSGTTNGYNYDTSPVDFLEGQGQGELLRPVSLYLDQLEKRLNSDPAQENYRVNILVRDLLSGEPVPGSRVIIYNDSITTDSKGISSFEGVLPVFIMKVETEFYHPVIDKQIRIYSDTTLTIFIEKQNYGVRIRLLDDKTGAAFPNVSVHFGSESDVTDANGEVQFNVVEGSYEYSLSKISYMPVSGTADICSDTLIEFYLKRSHAYIKFKLKEGISPVNNAVVCIGSDTIISNSLGISNFTDMPIEAEYGWFISKHGYIRLEGSILLQTDTIIDVRMEKDISSLNDPDLQLNDIWPNPAADYIFCGLKGGTGFVIRVLNPQGRCMLTEKITRDGTISIDIRNLSPGIYFVQIQTAGEKITRKFVKI